MELTAILEVLLGASAVIVGTIYIVGGLIVNLHLAQHGVTEYQVVRVKYFVVGFTYLLNLVALTALALLPALLIATLDFYTQQVFLVLSLLASLLLLILWGNDRLTTRMGRAFRPWYLWVIIGAIASSYPLSVFFRTLFGAGGSGVAFESMILIFEAILAGALAFIGQTYFYARHLYAAPSALFGSMDPIGVGVPVEVRLAVKEEAMIGLLELGLPKLGEQTLGPLSLLDETDTHYIVRVPDVTRFRAIKIEKEAVRAILYT
jgi:hypothetical protein